ncbi:carboxymuconolactone decarboxylase family protein [Nonomuraea sp. NPDC050556]|uniref:carboxymuconolactone decarboxylase family protein n=1 Tax=Nonomuraea sp. NPDC050556 TaxID=3364369 RepID=UPI0037BC9D4C
MDQKPRVAPLAESEWDDETRALLEPLRVRGQVGNIFATLVRHRELFARWLPFGSQLLEKGRLGARDRELLILRTASNCGAPYEWGHHVRIGARAGITEPELQRIAEGPDAPGWSAQDATLLRAADELHRDSRLSETTWAALAERFDAEDLVELTMLVGHYTMVAFALNSLGVQLEPGVRD